MYKVLISKSAEKELNKLSDALFIRVEKAIDAMSENPRPVGAKKLKGVKEDFWRVRVGQYRIIYTIDDAISIVDIRKFGNRKDVYR